MDTAQQKETIEFIYRLDNDDEASLGAKCIRKNNVKVIIGPRVILSSMWNEAAMLATSNILFQAGDDLVHRTPGWDQIVIAAMNQFPDGIALVHGDDLVHGQSFGTHCFISRAWMNILGYFVPGYFVSDYADLWLNEIANQLGRRVFCPNLITEHCHPCVGKAVIDETHQERLNRHNESNVASLYEALKPKIAQDVEKLRAYLQPQIKPEGQ